MRVCCLRFCCGGRKLRRHLENEHETLEHGFQRFDLNGNGALEPEEMRGVLVDMAAPPPKPKMDGSATSTFSVDIAP